MDYALSPFRVIESYLGLLLGLDEKKPSVDSKEKSHILSHTNYLQAFTQMKMFQEPVTQRQITKGLSKMNMMISMKTKPIMTKFEKLSLTTWTLLVSSTRVNKNSSKV